MKHIKDFSLDINEKENKTLNNALDNLFQQCNLVYTMWDEGVIDSDGKVKEGVDVKGAKDTMKGEGYEADAASWKSIKDVENEYSELVRTCEKFTKLSKK